MKISFYFKATKKGVFVMSDIMEMSIYKGIKAWGRTQDAAISNLVKKWNRKVNKTFKEIPANASVTKIQFKLKSA